jgi:plasmid stabilization system protein ParE
MKDMALKFQFRKRARVDLIEAADWYGQQNAEVGQNFVNDFNKTLAKIHANPETYRKVFLDYRKIQLDKFPYYIIYRLSKKVIYILAVYHNKRNDTWKNRIH